MSAHPAGTHPEAEHPEAEHVEAEHVGGEHVGAAAAGGTPARLTADTLAALPAGREVSVPAFRPAATGIVHLGIGAFHRAHQAVLTEDAALATGDDRWGICGVSQRSSAVVEQLGPQSGLYCLLERGPGAAPLRVVGSVREVLFAGAQGESVPDRIADPAVHVVTLTVTEKGYRRTSDGGLDLSDPAVAADLRGVGDLRGTGAPPVTVIGRLVAGLRRRRERGGPALTVLSCDNLVANGDAVRRLVEDFCAALPGRRGEPLREWIDAAVSFPCSMVDRIVPATTAGDRADAGSVLGLRDEGLVVAEPFRQWVIEDRFAGPRPPWEAAAGVTLTGEVELWEAVKLRLLNSAHSTLAYLGALAGHPTIAETMRDERVVAVAEALMREDATPTLRLPAGLDVQGYRAEVLHRFANPALRHTTVQIAMDGSQKLPVRLLGIVRDRLAGGEQPRWAALGVAAWMVYVTLAANVGRAPGGMPLPLDDPLAATLRSAVAGIELTPAGSADAAGQLVSRLLAVREIFAEDLAASPSLQALLVAGVRELSAGAPPRAGG